MDRRRMMMAKKGGLPKEYQEVEWISNGKAGWFMTNIYPTNEYYVELEVLKLGANSIFGIQTTPIFQHTNRDEIRRNGSRFYMGTSDVFRKLRIGRYVYVEDFETPVNDFGTAVFECVSPIAVFARSTSATAVNDISYDDKLKYLKVDDGSTVVLDLIPCYRKSDNEIGMYDLVSKTFFTNQGTGTFTKGADVN